MYGLHGKQIENAGMIAKVLSEEWRGLVAGREGFLVNKGQEGTVRWGEMVRERVVNGRQRAHVVRSTQLICC